MKTTKFLGLLAFPLATMLATVWGPVLSVSMADQLRQSPSPQVVAAEGAGDYIVMFREGTSATDRAEAARRAGAVLKFNYRIVDAVAVHSPSTGAMSALQRDPNVVAIVPDRPIYAIVKPDAPGGGKGKKGGSGGSSQVVPSGVQRIGAVPGGNPSGMGVGVAVVDTGVDFGHADLFVSFDCFDAFGGDCQDRDGHGTHVAGIVAALDNEIDVVGVAPNATLYAVKVLDNTGSGTDSTVMAGLDWIAMHPAIQVVNMSLGRPGKLDDNPALRWSIQALTNHGVSVVVAAGNDPNKQVSQMVPATYPEVMAIASTTALDGTNKCKFFSGVIMADTASYFTTDGKFDGEIGVTISAPGEKQEDINRGCFAKSSGILSTKLGGGTTRMSGTSMAAPHVSGVVALMLQNKPTLDAEGIRRQIRESADGNGATPLDSPTMGYSFDGEREGIVWAP